jgi:hypothetical protein
MIVEAINGENANKSKDAYGIAQNRYISAEYGRKKLNLTQ